MQQSSSWKYPQPLAEVCAGVSEVKFIPTNAYNAKIGIPHNGQWLICVLMDDGWSNLNLTSTCDGDTVPISFCNP